MSTYLAVIGWHFFLNKEKKVQEKYMTCNATDYINKSKKFSVETEMSAYSIMNNIFAAKFIK